ncbi:hypothetical protein FNV43_RR11038 [Rhamnella rubrinervis]|uniref:Uncharacterized protein n=1 Tax=Rhamnella rubrinervis TaxID=2594499 RepID=A0A8K0H4U1_9ROSA|nr:hypothetical protein FNV43_RR11038 [Rhamnella rubrinervis]
MGKLFSYLSYVVCGRRDALVVELVARHGVTLREDSGGRYWDFDEDPTEQRAIRAHVQARGYGGPPVPVGEPIEDDTNKDPKEDSLGTDDYAPHGYTSEPVDP